MTTAYRYGESATRTPVLLLCDQFLGRATSRLTFVVISIDRWHLPARPLNNRLETQELRIYHINSEKEYAYKWHSCSGGPRACETSRLPHFLDSRLTDGGEVVSLTRRPPFTPSKIHSTHWYDPRAIVRLEEFDQFKNPTTSSGIKPATFRLDIMPQPTMLPHMPNSFSSGGTWLLAGWDMKSRKKPSTNN
jgi:hypothetical protein